MLNKFKESIPENIPYIRREDIVDVEGKENDINPALFKRNKFGLFFNSFDVNCFLFINGSLFY